MNDRLTDGVRAFIARNIRSVEQLEVLLYARNHPDISHNAPELARQLRSDVRSIAMRLIELERVGLLGKTGEGYAYVASGALDAAVRSLAEAYADRRVAVIAAIYSGAGN